MSWVRRDAWPPSPPRLDRCTELDPFARQLGDILAHADSFSGHHRRLPDDGRAHGASVGSADEPAVITREVLARGTDAGLFRRAVIG
jgi:hypothetical protein